jgi:hypothetical protein
MSETNVGPAIPRPTGAAEASDSYAAGGRRAAQPEPTAWVGMMIFAGTMMIMLGAFEALQGFVALFKEDLYYVGPEGLAVQIDYSAWGWVHLILSAVVIAGGAALLAGKMWGRVLGLIVAFLSALVNIAFLAAFPVWSVIMIVVSVLVIWALTVHGAEMRVVYERDMTYP